MSNGPEEPADKGASPRKDEGNWFDRNVWLGARLASVRAAAFSSGQPGFDSFDLARQIRDEAGRLLHTSGGVWVALLLDCIAVELLVRSHLARAGQAASLATLGESDWAAVQTILAVRPAFARFPAAQMPTLMAAMAPDRVTILSALSTDERLSFANRLHELVRGLAQPLELEANSVGWVLFVRWVRIAALALTVACIIGIVVSLMPEPPNLAFRRPVTASSLNGYGPDASRLVDGVTDQIGFHTNGGDQQWVVIDLGEPKKFDKVVVYNRPDCCRERTVPLKIEVSDDNIQYRQIAEQTTVFEKWTAKNLHAEGRYVRLKNTPPNLFHLAEVEIY